MFPAELLWNTNRQVDTSLGWLVCAGRLSAGLPLLGPLACTVYYDIGRQVHVTASPSRFYAHCRSSASWGPLANPRPAGLLDVHVPTPRDSVPYCDTTLWSPVGRRHDGLTDPGLATALVLHISHVMRPGRDGK